MSGPPEQADPGDERPDPNSPALPDLSPAEQPEPLPRLDPDLAISSRAPEQPPLLRPGELAIDTRKYQWMIGGFGLFLVILFSIYLYAHGGSTQPGILPGHPLHRFVAPLATSDLNVAANAHPRCDPARPARRGLNICGRKPTVLALFVVFHKPCVAEVDALQRIAPAFPGVKFAAVAVNANRAATAALVRRHHWTIQVAYDETGVIGEVYGMAVCPLLELARAGGIVQQRLIGESCERPAVLAAAVRRLVSAG